MTKKKTAKPPREVTRRQLSRWQKQKKRQRITFGVGTFIIAAVVAVVGIGWYINEYQPLHQTVIRVNDTEFDMNYYVNKLEFYGAGQGIYYFYSIANMMEERIIESELIRQSALKLGISVSDGEVDEELESRDLPLTREHRDAIRTDVLKDKLKDEHFEHEVPVSAEHRHIMAMFLESERQALEMRRRLEAGEDFGELAEEFSLDSFSQPEKGDLGWQTEEALALLVESSVPGEYAFGSEAGSLSQPLHDEDKARSVGYWLVKVLEREEETEEARVQLMLLKTEREARRMRDRLEAGEDFAALTEEFSQHERTREKGGDLGWVSSGLMSPAIDEFVFDSGVELGTVSEPIKDEGATVKGGYWLVEVLGIDESRQIDQDDRDMLKEEALNDWISGLPDDPDNEVVSYLDEDMKRWAAERAYNEAG